MAPKNSIGDAYKLFFQNLFNFQGRTRRSDYWPVVIINSLAVSFVSGIISGIFSGIASSSGSTALASIGSGISSLLSLALTVLELGLVVRRLHDAGKEWTYLLFSLIPFVGWIIVLIPLLKDSEPGDNKFGPNPKGAYGDPNGFNQGYAPQQPYAAAPQQPYAPQQQPYAAPQQQAYEAPQQQAYAPQQPAYEAPQPQAYEAPQQQAYAPQQPVYEAPQPQAPVAPVAPPEPPVCLLLLIYA